MVMFDRPHHRRIAQVLAALDADLLLRHGCLFGGGTALALLHHEYRESVDMDFLVSRRDGFMALRDLLRGASGATALFTTPPVLMDAGLPVRIDPYGLRTRVVVDDVPIKFEIVHEARIELDPPGPDDRIIGIATLTKTDLAASKLLALSDRWADDGVFSRDVIDLALMQASPEIMVRALEKAEQAYGKNVRRDLGKALQALQSRPGRLDACLRQLRIDMPKALVWQHLKTLQRYSA